MTSFEQQILAWMITLYCRRMHKPEFPLCPVCAELLEYAKRKSETCPHKKNKPVCSACTIHCYDAPHREAIRRVMRFSGPRIFIYKPLAGLWYLTKRFASRKAA